MCIDIFIYTHKYDYHIHHLQIAVCNDVSVKWVCIILYTHVITQDGRSALMEATSKGRTDVVVELVKAGANVDMQDKV